MYLNELEEAFGRHDEWHHYEMGEDGAADAADGPRVGGCPIRVSADYQCRSCRIICWAKGQAADARIGGFDPIRPGCGAAEAFPDGYDRSSGRGAGPSQTWS